MTCEELLRILNDYIDGEIDLALCQKFAEHLAGCSPCQVVIDNIRKTIQLYKAGQPYEMPLEFSRALRAELRAKWKTKFPTSVS
jgi:predicted anti-sigma-YlaC factor YlaD